MTSFLFAFFHYQAYPQDEGSIEDNHLYNGLKISNWFTSFLLPCIYAHPKSVEFDNVELQVSTSHNHFLILGREK
jgi:hypothetical protein